MKSTLISMIIVLCVLAVVPMLLFGDRDWLAKFGLGPKDELSELRAKAPKNFTNVTTDRKVTVYKWRDEHGVMQFSNTPPPEGSDADTVELLPNANVVKAIKVPGVEPEKKTGPVVISTRSPYTPAGMKDLLDNTAQLKDTLSQQQMEQQKMMEQMFGKQP
jgi:Domain of unknown function (DUF4124)